MSRCLISDRCTSLAISTWGWLTAEKEVPCLLSGPWESDLYAFMPGQEWHAKDLECAISKHIRRCILAFADIEITDT